MALRSSTSTARRIVHLLLTHGADVDEIDNRSETALDIAIRYQRFRGPQLVELLRNHGAI